MPLTAAHRDPGCDGSGIAFPAMGWTLPPGWPVWLPLIFLLGMSGMVVGLNLDLVLARCFWSDTSGWSFAHAGWAQWIYRWSNVPVLVIGGTGLLVGLVSWRISRLRPWRRPAWFLALALLAGPGLTVNALLKPYYGRPRPRMVREFRGKESFRPLGSPTFDSTERSFPSGHASMAFYWLAPMILFWRNHRKLALAFLLLALVHGGTTGFVRMAQGAHWLSDVLWSAGIVYFTALAVHVVLPGSSAGGANGVASTNELRDSAPVHHRERRAGISKYNNWSRAVAGIHDLVGVSWLLKRKLPATAPLPKR